MNEPKFDDEKWSGAYCDSAKAREAMTKLATEHGLSFTHNPGGGEFYKDGWRCQIHMCNDVADYEKLRKALEAP